MTAEQQPAQAQSQNAIVAAAGRFKDLLGNLLREATGRLKKNAAYFRVNYLAILLVVTVTCMLLNPTSLIVLGCLAMLWAYFFGVRTAPVVIGGRTFSEREKFIALTAASAIVIFFLTSVGTILFTALGISVVTTGLHGALRVPDDLFTDEAEAQSGLLGFFSSPGNSAAALANAV